MGSSFSENLPNCCGGASSSTEAEINTEQSKNKGNKSTKASMSKYIKIVKEIDGKRSENKLKFEDYKFDYDDNKNGKKNLENKATTIYIYWIMLLDIVRGVNGFIAANPNTLTSNKGKFNTSKDPFDCIHKKWDKYNDTEKQMIIDIAVALTLYFEAKDIEKKIASKMPVPAFDKMPPLKLSDDRDELLTKKEMNQFKKSWHELNLFEKKAYSLKFTMLTVKYAVDFEPSDPTTYYEQKLKQIQKMERNSGLAQRVSSMHLFGREAPSNAYMMGGINEEAFGNEMERNYVQHENIIDDDVATDDDYPII